MALDNRDLKAGQKLVARYKGQEHTVLVLGDETTNGLGFELDAGTIYKSLSSAGNAVTGGSVNGWRFWSLEGSLPTKGAKTESTAAKWSDKPERRVRLIKKVPNQKGVPASRVKWFCSGCMKSFLADVAEDPQTCPEGHGREATDEFVTAD